MPATRIPLPPSWSSWSGTWSRSARPRPTEADMTGNGMTGLPGHLLLPEDPEGPLRAQRPRELGLGESDDPALDAFARDLATAAGAPFGMVNFIYADHLYHAGMYA